MKTILFILIFGGFTFAANSQSIMGTWQLVKESDCLEQKLSASNDSAKAMVEEMKSMSPASPQIVTFKEKMAGEESSRILTRKKTTNNKSFLYKFDGETLLVLDKKSHTITDNFLVDKFSTDSLIISNASRPCETRIFLKIK